MSQSVYFIYTLRLKSIFLAKFGERKVKQINEITGIFEKENKDKNVA